VLRNSAGPLLENNIFIYDGSRGDATKQRGVAEHGGQTPGTTARVLGNIIYGNSNSQSGVEASFTADRLTSAIVEHLVVDARNGYKPAGFSCQSGCIGPNVASNITTIRRPEISAPTFTADWTGGNRHDGTSLAKVPNIFTGANAANICKRYENGILTNTPLWPWPMDQRIKAAIDIARLGQSTPGDPKSPLLTGNSVTAEIEGRFGAIPSQCRNR
jgi:hypothetical protein